MNYKTYKVWKILLDNPNVWMDIIDISHKINMTSRQVSSIIGTFPSPPVIKERDKHTNELQVFIKGTDEEIFKLRDKVVSECFDLTDDMKMQVHDSLSPIGWMSVADIAEDTGVDRLDVARILSVTGDITTKSTGSVTLYRLQVM